MVSVLITAFWSIINLIGTTTGMTTTLQTLNTFATNVSNAVQSINPYIANVYYFVDKNTLVYLLTLGIIVVIVRINMAIINLIVW